MPAAADTRSRRSCSGWCQPLPSAGPARPRAGLVTGIPAATRLPLVAQLPPALNQIHPPSDDDDTWQNKPCHDPDQSSARLKQSLSTSLSLQH